MITKLTKSQEQSVIPFREKWRSIGLSTERSDKESSEKAIIALYKELGKKPPLFIFCPSPLFCIQQINFFKFLGKKSNLESNLWSNLESNLGSNLRSNLESNLWSNLRSNLESNLGSNLESNLGSNLESNLWSNLRSNLESNLWSNLRSNLRSNLESNQKSEDKFIKELSEYHEFYGYGQMDSAWIAFYQFMETIGIKYTDNESKLLEHWAQTAKSCSWFWTFENYVFVSDRPTKLHFNESYRLHSELEPAYEYSDGWAGYYLDGVHLSQELWRKIIDKSLPAKDALAIENQDQRTVAMQYLGGEKILKELDGKKFAKDKYGELWTLDIKDTNGNPYIYYVAPDPSKNNQMIYLRTAPTIKTPKEAMTRAYRLTRWEMSYNPSVRT